MLTVFRKIRHALLESNSINKYLLYAIGEIALVVIGILIALQINNWNEYRKERKIERSTLMEISFDLMKDTTRIANDIARMQNSRNIIGSVIAHIEEKEPPDSAFSNSVMAAYSAHSPTLEKFNSAAFDLLKERGTDIISNTELRKKIVDHYTGEYSAIDGWFTNLRDVWTLEANRLYDHFRISVITDDDIQMIPNNYNNLINDPSLMNPFYHFEALMVSSLVNLTQLQHKTQDLLNDIRDELGDK